MVSGSMFSRDGRAVKGSLSVVVTAYPRKRVIVLWGLGNIGSIGLFYKDGVHL